MTETTTDINPGDTVSHRADPSWEYEGTVLAIEPTREWALVRWVAKDDGGYWFMDADRVSKLERVVHPPKVGDTVVLRSSNRPTAYEVLAVYTHKHDGEAYVWLVGDRTSPFTARAVKVQVVPS